MVRKGGGSVKPYIIIKGGGQPILMVPYRRGRGVQKSEKLPYVIYEGPLTEKQLQIFFDE